jgi:rhodanese-related sulfurtransferase
MDRLVEFIGNHPQLFIALAVIVGLIIATYVRAGLQGFKSLEPTDAIDLINHRDAVVLDTREVNELEEGTIVNAVHIPLGQLSSKLDKLQQYKSRPVIASCRSGSRSGVAANTLVKNGFEEVYNLRGGILAWKNANLPLEKKRKKKGK